MSEPAKPYVCTVCLRELLTFSKPCERCGSRKIEHREFLRMLHGEHWRELLQGDKGMVN